MIIICALHCEASPIISALSLKKDYSSHSFELYANENILLALSGMGKIKAAIATTFALRTWLANNSNPESLLAINVGVCGAKPNYNIGQIFIPNKIVDGSSNRAYYPDILAKHNFNEGSLITVDHPVKTQEIPNMLCDLCDMEGSGFFEAASCFLTSSQALAFKVPSDHGVDTPLTKSHVTELIERNIKDILKYASHAQEILKLKPSPLSKTDFSLLEDISNKLRLTQYQNNQLKNLAISYKIRSKLELDILKEFLQENPEDKKHVKIIFERIVNALTT
jgi:Phosphorylase superfamily